MNYLETIFYCMILFAISSTPAYFAFLNKKSDIDKVRIRFLCWGLGWTGVAWLWALVAACRADAE